MMDFSSDAGAGPSQQPPKSHRLRKFVSKCYSKLTCCTPTPKKPMDIPPPPPPKDTPPAPSPISKSEASVQISGVSDYGSTTRAVFTTHYTSRSILHTTPPLPPLPTITAETKPYPSLPATVVLPRMRSVHEIRRLREEAARQVDHSKPPPVPAIEEKLVHIQLRKEAFEQQLAEEARQRKIEVQMQVQRAAVLRQEREQQERMLEERRRIALEQKRREEREKRLQRTQALQDWRQAMTQQMEDEARRKLETRRYVHVERRTRPIQSARVDTQCHAWITVQMDTGSGIWKRRFCKIEDHRIRLYKNAAQNEVVDDIDILSIRKLVETGDDYEELEGLPHSFALQFADGHRWNAFMDNEGDKELLVSVIVQLARL